MIRSITDGLGKRDKLKILINRVLRKRMDELIENRLEVGLKISYGNQFNMLIDDLAEIVESAQREARKDPPRL